LDGVPPIEAIIDELCRCYPIDRRRVFVLGHSMGAGHTIGAIQLCPGRFAAAAALGGGGNIRRADAVQDLPVFVAVGSSDFLIGAARALASSLKKAGARTVFKEYRDIEHMAVLPEAIPEIFAFFDRVSSNRPESGRIEDKSSIRPALR
jgi:predicted peptidase